MQLQIKINQALARVYNHSSRKTSVRSEDFSVSEPSPDPHREISFGTVDGKTWKVVFIRSSAGEIFPITAHRLDPKRRRNP